MLRKSKPKDMADDAVSNSELTEVGPNDVGVPGTVMCFAYALPFTYTDLRADLENCKKFLLSNEGKVVNEIDQSPLRKKKKVHKQTTSLDLDFDEAAKLPSKKERMDRHILSKNEIA